MWKTALFLLITIVVVPVIAFRTDDPLTAFQKAMLMPMVYMCIGTALLCFVISSITNNYSQVDKLWSIMPILYAWMPAVHSGFEPRLLIMAILVTVWGIRLSFNFGRKGGYSWKIWSGEQDYRWAVLQNKPEFSARWKWMLFNLLFISIYQMGLILLMTLPALRSIGGKPLSWGDGLIALLMLGLIVVEFVADQQMWNFHLKKKALAEPGGNAPGDLSKGFIHTGLWGVVRHPNYTAEQAIWVVFYLFSVAATGQWLNWSVTGAMLLLLLFKGSSDFSESISAGKYPEYSAYQKKVPRFLPFIKI